MKRYEVKSQGVKFPYSAAVEAGGFVYVSGQIPVDNDTGEMITGSIEAETEQVFANLKAVLALAGLTLSDVVKTTVFLSSMENFGAMNGVYERQFIEGFPARSAFAVAGLPRGARVEIEAIALKK